MVEINSVYILFIGKRFINNKASGIYKELKVNINNSKDRYIVLPISKRLNNKAF